jgi:hypothetical protein
MLVARAAARIAGLNINRRRLTLRLAYMLVPIGIFAWIAFSLPSVMVNYNYILVVLSDPLGLGWDILGTALEGPLAGDQLSPIPHHDTFWFAWAAFVPDGLLSE